MIIRISFLVFSILFSGVIWGQKSKTNSAKLDFIQYPSIPVSGMEKLGIQLYTADLPFNKDTLRLYLGNMDIMKSNVERMSKVDFKALNEVSIIGGEGDVTIDMAFGKPVVLSKEEKTTSCVVAKDGCTQYFYLVSYRLPTLVRARNSSGTIETWELPSEMTLRFGNEQIEKHKKTDKGSSTSVQVVSYTSAANLASAFNKMGQASLVRKAIVRQIGKMAESVYERAFFEESKLKLDIAYGSGSAADYSETETASANAITALEQKNYQALNEPIKIWETWLSKYDPNNKKAAVNNNVAQGLHENLSIAYTFTNEFDKARTNLDKALKLAQTGFVNTNEVDKLKAFHSFIDKQERVKMYNSNLSISQLVTAPDIKQTLGRRKFNENINFLFPEDKYAELSKEFGKSAPQNNVTELSPLEQLLSQQNTGGNSTANDGEISLDGRVENNMLVLSGLVDGNMRGKALPSSICDYPDIKTIRARNIGLISLPDCFNKLTKLEKLYINSNSFTELPDAFASMKSLEILDISNNNLKTIPPSIFTLTGLKKLFISGNQFSEADMKKLKESLTETTIK